MQRADPQRAQGKSIESHEFQGIFRVFAASFGYFQGASPYALSGCALWTLPREGYRGEGFREDGYPRRRWEGGYPRRRWALQNGRANIGPF